MVRPPNDEASNPEKKETIMRFESYIDNVLTVDLQKYHKSFHSKEADMEEWLQLKRMITTMKENNLPGFKGKMSLGANIYVPVEVPDTSKMILHLGCGIFVEMTQDDALTYIDSQVKGLERELAHINDCMAGLKARIQVIVQGINELEMIEFVPDG